MDPLTTIIAASATNVVRAWISPRAGRQIDGDDDVDVRADLTPEVLDEIRRTLALGDPAA